MFARPGLPCFDYIRAHTIDEAVELLKDHGQDARPLMGGTDLFPGLREGRIRPRVLVDIKGLPGIRQLAYEGGTGLRIGAAVTMNEVIRHPRVQAHYPLLAQAAASVASYQIRNRATLGGNLCNASPCADTAPACLVMNAKLDLYGPSGHRLLRTADFFLGPGLTALEPGELLTAIHFPPPPTRVAGCYLKLGRCRSGDLSLVGIAILAYVDGNGSSPHFRIGLGSVAPTAVRASEAEAYLEKHPSDEETFAAAADRAMASASPINDVRGTAEYQRAMVRTLTLRGLRDVWAQLTPE
ncbi:MAG: FAD binding domain-containing protein [Anaerolineae bacterium]